MAEAPMPEQISFMNVAWTGLGFVGAGISIGVRLSRGEKINDWTIYTTLVAGAMIGGTCTQGLVDLAGLKPFWAGGVALLLGLMAMGFVINVYDRKVPFINKLLGFSDEHKS